MLLITPDAGLAIQALTEQAGVAVDGGLRIDTLSANGSVPNFALSIAALPDEADQVVTEETTGSRVLLDSLTASYLADQELDVSSDAEGAFRFRFTPTAQAD
ncbi:hypothetical protein GCM10010174_73460 [Kutzneria viridogrisea]|uniref:Fe-S cluster assembly iron-binding protein IscA n=2 Tax=Kutzneria TaxID=43356 RepID=W5WGV9_9PSEU|nr:hypothetical protein [Kutzneria albida]AHH97399.1 hypothetical protein KALB_4035 [Kutzneria albida DSM 43870]MBA8930682.1 Fe-S cluster assembly iron-binding protein IscA [Kutzneria viridogrisea]